jgi:hypothetical protein
MFKKKNFLHRENLVRSRLTMFILVLFHLLVVSHLKANSNTGAPVTLPEDTITGTVTSPSSHVLQVYLDCRRCDFDFIRTELNFVNYVRDPELADLHVFVTDERTGGGGREYQFTFIGRGPFSGTSYTLKHYTDRDATEDENREALKQFLKMGYASYLFQTPMGKRFDIIYRGEGAHIISEQIDDPWNHWVFQAYLGQVRLDLESNMSVFNSRWGFFADRVTNQWKLRFRPYFNYGRVKIQTSSEKDPLYSTQRRHGVDSYAIKSITRHWSAGLFADYQTYNGRNLKHQVIVSPGIEFSIFPYEEATRKSITFTYLFGTGYHDYFEETIFGKNEEILFNQSLRGLVNIQQPWGNIETGLTASHYFHDPSRRRIEFYGRTSIRVFEGFSVSFQAEYQVVRDQLSLPKGSASIEDVLLKQRELATDFSFTGSVAVSYTFGSRFANVVNTRF